MNYHNLTVLYSFLTIIIIVHNRGIIKGRVVLLFEFEISFHCEALRKSSEKLENIKVLFEEYIAMMTYPIFSKSNKIFSSVGLHPLVNNRVRRLYAYSVSGIMIVMTILYVVESCRGGWKSVKHEISSLVFTIFLSSEFFTSMMRFTRREKINRIIEQKFCSTFRTSLRKIDFQENCLIWFWLVLMCLVHIFWLLLPIIGMQNRDTEETKRVLPEILWWPFFDLSKHPHYEIAYVVEIYITVYYVIVSFDVATTVPIISLHIYGQMKVMAFYLKKVGKTDFKGKTL